jgi:hypothetical protein
MEQSYRGVFNALVINGSFLHFLVPRFKLKLVTNVLDTIIGAALFQLMNDKKVYLGFHSRIL